MTEQAETRGTPPSEKDLGRELGARKALWDAVVTMVKEFGATWKWMHSEALNTWSFRAYQPGDRFFVSLSRVDDGFELSFNMKAEEWDWVAAGTPREQAMHAALREKALASGDEPAWLHVAITEEAQLPAMSQLLFARARRVQAPRGKKKGRR